MLLFLVKQFLYGQEISATAPVDGAHFFSMKNLEQAKRAADFQNFIECLADDLGITKQNAAIGTNTVLTHNCDVGRFNCFSGEKFASRSSVYAGDNITELEPSYFTYYNVPGADGYAKKYGIDITQEIPTFYECVKTDRNLILKCAEKMAIKVSQAYLVAYDLNNDTLQPVWYKYDFARGKNFCMGNGHNAYEQAYSKIDSSVYIPTEYSLNQIKERTVTYNVERIINELGLDELENLRLIAVNSSQYPRAVERNNIRTANNQKKIKGKLKFINDVIESGEYKKEVLQDKNATMEEFPLPVELEKAIKASFNKIAYEVRNSFNSANLQESQIKAILDEIWQTLVQAIKEGLNTEDGALKILPEVLEKKFQEASQIKPNTRNSNEVDGKHFL